MLMLAPTFGKPLHKLMFIYMFISANMVVADAFAATLSMICKNPRRHYRVVFDDFSRVMNIRAEGDETSYRVDSVARIGNAYTVKGVTVFGGPSYSALIGGSQQLIQYFQNGRLMQTDYCS